VEGCGVGGVSGEIEEEMREGRGGGTTGDPVTGVGRYEEGTRVWPDVACEYTVGGMAL